MSRKKRNSKDAKTQTPTPEAEVVEAEVVDAVADDAAVADADTQEAEVQAVETLTPEEVAALHEQLTAAEKRADEYLDGLQRERATFQNYKKRVERERVEQQQTLVSGVLLKLLPTLDDFHRAMEAVPAEERNQWFEGIALIQRKLEGVLKDHGVTEIQAEGQPFDPNFHEAIGVEPDTGAESGTVTTVLQRGYMINDRVLRPAMVRVAD